MQEMYFCFIFFHSFKLVDKTSVVVPVCYSREVNNKLCCNVCFGELICFSREVKHFKIHTVVKANNFNKLKVILIRITS